MKPPLLCLLLALGAQLAFGAWNRTVHPAPVALVAAPDSAALRMAALGDEVAFARLLMLWLQAADGGPHGGVALLELDYAALRSWLERIAELDPRSRYPLLAASHVYAAVGDAARVRTMLDFVRTRFLHDPNRHWPFMAHAALVARHRLADPALALSYARELRTHTAAGVLPPWALQLQAWFAADMSELDSARALIGALISDGRIRDPRELRLLERRLQELERAQR